MDLHVILGISRSSYDSTQEAWWYVKFWGIQTISAMICCKFVEHPWNCKMDSCSWCCLKWHGVPWAWPSKTPRLSYLATVLLSNIAFWFCIARRERGHSVFLSCLRHRLPSWAGWFPLNISQAFCWWLSGIFLHFLPETVKSGTSSLLLIVWWFLWLTKVVVDPARNWCHLIWWWRK